MAIAFRSSSTAYADGVGTLTLTKPSGVVSGDVLIVAIVGTGGTVTAPSGWTSVQNKVNSGTTARIAVFRRVADGSEGGSFGFTIGSGGAQDSAGIIAAYSGVSSSSPVNISASAVAETFGSTATAPSVTTTESDCLILAIHGAAATTSMSTPSGTTLRAEVESVSGVFASVQLADYPQVSAGATGTKTSTVGSSIYWAAAQVALTFGNDPPNAPTLAGPVGGVSIDLAATQRFSWTFSDPDLGDTQSKFDLRYRPAAGGTWTDITQTTPNNFYDLPAATLTAGDYEWQVRTYDALGLVGPFSSSAFFTAATTPPGPTITDPVNGQTIPSADYTATISYPDMDSWEWRVLGDDGGNPDETDVIIPATTRPSTARTFHMQGLPNDTIVHPQVRVSEGGLWSQWVSSSNPVSFTPPAVPSVVASVDNLAGAIRLQATHPEPDGGQPAVVAVDWWRRRLLHDADGLVTGYDPAEGGEAGIPLARGASQPPAAMWTDWQVASGAEYAYRARARGDNDTSTFSAWSDVVTWDSDVVTWDSDVVTWN